MELRILNIAGPLIKVSITDGKRLILHFIIPHVNSPYKTSIDERLIFYNITRFYSDDEYCHSFAIAASDIIQLLTYVEVDMECY